MVKKALVLLTSILFALPLLMPFNIYASATHLVQTDYLSTVSTDWRNSMSFTSYCEGTNASTASCVLTVNITKSPKNYFGTVTIHGYSSDGTKWINYGDIFVSAGTGVYNYNFYQDGIKEITRVEVYSTNLIQPSSTVDLSQIISLLTSINNYEQQSKNLLDVIDDNTLNTVNEIKNVISELIVSNGYLETLTKIRQYNVANESLLPVLSFFRRFELYEPQDGLYFSNFPIFKVPQNSVIYTFNTQTQPTYAFIFYANRPIYNKTNFLSNFDIEGINEDTLTVTYLDRMNVSTGTNIGYQYLVKATFKYSSSGLYSITYKQVDTLMSPIFINKVEGNYSTDFCLLYGLTNPFLKNIDLIANGTTASQSAADSSQSANEQLQTESNTLFQQENGFKSDMQNAMQNVNNTFRLQDMGTKFVSSAQWVRSQYESLTNNTPFASLITFSLITGLALILLGKVYK